MRRLRTRFLVSLSLLLSVAAVAAAAAAPKPHVVLVAGTWHYSLPGPGERIATWNLKQAEKK